MPKIADAPGRASLSSPSTMHEVRSALRADRSHVTLDDDVAPLANELLPRLDALVAEQPEDLAPRPPGHDLPDLATRARLLSGLATKLAAHARAEPDNPAITRATQIVRAHVALTTELALRVPTRT